MAFPRDATGTHPRLPFQDRSTMNSEEEDDEEEEEEEYHRDPHANLVEHVRTADRGQKKNQLAMAYLLRYESMVRQQEAEDMATLEHLRPCLERLAELGKNHQNDNEDAATEKRKKNPQEAEEESLWKQTISLANLRRALEILEQGQTAQNHPGEPPEFMTTDRQLMMVLRLLTQSPESRVAPEHTTWTWAEIVQCYKACILGMTTLQHLPHADEIRQRVRDRTLAMLALFEPQMRLWSSPSNFASSMRTSRTAPSALTASQRSSFAPRRATRRNPKRRLLRLVAALSVTLVLAATVAYYGHAWLAKLHIPNLTTVSPKARSGAHKTAPGSPPPTSPMLSIRSLVQPTMASGTAKFDPRTLRAATQMDGQYYHYGDDDEEEDLGVTGPALLVGTVGTPVTILLAQKVLQHMGSGAAFVSSTATLSAYGSVMVTVAGFVSLGSLLVRSLRAVFMGLGRLGKARSED